MTRLFDAYIAVDWSSRNVASPKKPSSDAIWIGEKLSPKTTKKEKQRETYWPTRSECISYLKEKLKEHVAQKRRVFLGFDFAYGYPSGYANALGLKGPLKPWQKIWKELSILIEDDQKNNNNRFQVAAKLNAKTGNRGPLWGCPMNLKLKSLNPKSPKFPFKTRNRLVLNRFRLVDSLEPRIQPVWKLAYTASVGSQVLVGIPKVAQLRNDKNLSAFSKVWPFETGFTSHPTPPKGPFILHVEIWPGVISDRLDKSIPIRDKAQVRATVDWLSGLDDKGKLGQLFDTPMHLTKKQIKACVEEEGWIVGGGLKRYLPKS